MSARQASRFVAGLALSLAPLTACGAEADSPVVAEPVAAGSSPEPSSDAEIADCAIVPRVSDSSAADRRWISSEKAGEAREPIEKLLDQRFGPEGKSSNQLDAGYLGPAFDNVREQYIVVVDPEVVTDAAALQQELTEAGAERNGRNTDIPIIDARVQEACVSVPDLLEAREVIRAEAWHPDAEGSVGPYFLDAGASAYRVPIGGPNAEEVGAALKRQLGPAVIIGP